METNQKNRLHPIVVALVGDALAENWWVSPNKAFKGKAPIDCDFMDVRDYLVWHAYCAGG